MLVARWRAGDEAAAQALVALHLDDLYRFFEHKLPDAADDLVQQTFTKCLEARQAFRGEASFRTYLFKIARNELNLHLRGLHRGDRVDLEVSSLADLVTSHRTQLAREQERERLRAALRQLPVETQTLLELHYWHDFDAASLARIFEQEPGAIRVRLHRARRALRAQLGAQREAAARDPMASSLGAPDLDLPEA